MPAVTIRNKKGGLRKVDLTKPAVVIDAYDAYNLITDYGMNCGVHDWRTFSHQVATAFVGDMGMNRHYFLQERFDGKPLNLNAKARPSTTSDKIAELGAVDYGKYAQGNITQMVLPAVESSSVAASNFTISPYVLQKYQRLRNLDKLYIYTDYAPREQGSRRYEQQNQPQVVIDYRLFPDGGYQHTYRDRHYMFKGYSVCTDFYSPDYGGKPLPAQARDYRRTLLWMPDVRFDENGEATVKLYNNSKTTAVSIELEGICHQNQLTVWKTE